MVERRRAVDDAGDFHRVRGIARLRFDEGDRGYSDILIEARAEWIRRTGCVVGIRARRHRDRHQRRRQSDTRNRIQKACFDRHLDIPRAQNHWVERLCPHCIKY